MLRALAILFGAVLFAIGLLGFRPEFVKDGLLLDTFRINEIHNWIHVATGAVAFLCGLAGTAAARNFFRIFGLIYGLVAILGFYYRDQPIFGLIANNMADTFLHTGIALFSLWLGFCSCCGGSCKVEK